MCAVIGAYIENVNSQDLIKLANVFRESSIRGLHATGISWIKQDKIHTHIEPIPARSFVSRFNLEQTINEDGNLYLIGHCRYSTSDLEYNQPLYNNRFSIVHNGVVSQEMPENWESLYGYKCQTRNDSELILHALNDALIPMETFPDSSMAAIELHLTKKICFYRNGKRPIYFTKIKNGYIITSTADIANRSELSDPKQVKMGEMITIRGVDSLSYKIIDMKQRDLQPV